MHNYKKLEVRQESVNLVTEIYLLTDNYPNKEKFYFRSTKSKNYRKVKYHSKKDLQFNKITKVRVLGTNY
jgi:hypothetical protein